MLDYVSDHFPTIPTALGGRWGFKNGRKLSIFRDFSLIFAKNRSFMDPLTGLVHSVLMENDRKRDLTSL